MPTMYAQSHPLVVGCALLECTEADTQNHYCCCGLATIDCLTTVVFGSVSPVPLKLAVGMAAIPSGEGSDVTSTMLAKCFSSTVTGSL